MRVRQWIKSFFCTALTVSMVLNGGFLPNNQLTAYAADFVVQAGEIPTKAISLEELPSSLNCVEAGASIQTPKDVTWKITSGSFMDAGSRVAVTATIKENKQEVKATILAVPENVVYLVDCNTTADSSADFKRFKAEADDSTSLINTQPDQEYATGGWGYIKNGFGSKGLMKGEYAETKHNTGYYGNGGKPVQYKLQLEKGTYTIAASLFEWWGGQDRDTRVTVTFVNSENANETKSLGNAHFTSFASSKVVEGSFTILSAQEVTVSFEKAGNADAAVSGFTVLKTDKELPPEDKSIAFTVDGDVVDEANTFGGFGTVTCNNTSRLLLDYKEKSPDQYWEMMNMLFDKENGAGLHHIKIEMGADVNSSSGTEPATMRGPDEEANVKRGAGYHFAADAKTINPDITVEILRWGEPKWTQEGLGYEDYENPKYEARYQWYRKTIDAVYETYGYKINEVSPGQNERNRDHADDFAWIKYCAKRFDEDAANGIGAYDYSEIKIVAADLYRGMGTTVKYLKDDAELRGLVDVISDHYAVNLGSADLTWLNQEEGIEVWYGEAIAPMINANYRINVEPEKGGVGGSTSIADIAERYMAAYSYKSSTGHPSRMTNFLFQPAIAAFYEGSSYSPKQLIGAFDPWSGYYEADGGIQMVKQLMLFGDEDWQYLPEACYSDGKIGDGGMVVNTSTDVRMAVKDPETDDYSLMFANNTTSAREYKVTLKNMDTVNNAYNVWETKGPKEGEAYDSGWFQKTVDKAMPEDQGDGTSIIRLTVEPYSVVTLTTLVDRGESYVSGSNIAKDRDGNVIERSILELPYRDNFDYEDAFVEERGGTPLYATDLEGAFEVVKANDANGYVLQQRINNENRPYNWNPWGSGSDESSQTTGTPWTVLGDHRWANYTAGVDFKLDTTSEGYGDNFAVLGVRELVHSSGAAYRGRVYKDGKWELLRFGSVKKSGKVDDFNPDIWHKLQMKADEDTITMYLDGIELADYTDNSSSPVMTGRVTMMSGFWNTSYDNLEVLPVETKAVAATVKIDNTSPLLTYGGQVSHAVGEGFAHYNRTRTTMKQGSTMEFHVENGQGFDIFGNSGSATIKVEKDGAVIENSKATFGAGNRETSYWNQAKLDAGTVKITVLNGEYIVDGVNVFGIADAGGLDLYKDELVNMIAYAEGLTWEGTEYPPLLIDKLNQAIENGKATQNNAATQIEIDSAALAVRNALIQIVPSDTIVEVLGSVKDMATMVGEMPALPETVKVLNAAGEEATADITWNVTEEDFEKPWSTVKAVGTIGGTKKEITALIQVVPLGLTHFIDSGTIGVLNDGGESGHSEVYDIIAGSIDLENEKSDKIYADGSWGYINEDMNIKGGSAVNYNTDIYTSGLYSGNKKDIIYKVPLKAGKYIITTGYQAYWNEERKMDVWVKYEDAEGTQQKKSFGTVTVNTSNNNIYHDGLLELPKDCVVEIHAGKNSGSKDPILSWVAITDEAFAEQNRLTLNTELPIIAEKGAIDFPESVNVSYRGETKDVDVTWSLRSGDVTKTGSTVTFEGRLKDLNNKKVTWSPVIYSKDLVYFIDAGIMDAGGSPKTSEIYDTVAKVTTLKNGVPDQAATGNTWGYHGPSGTKNYEVGRGLQATGWYGENKNDEFFTYKLLLDAGDYQINTGHTEWWTQNRGTEVKVSYVDDKGETVEKILGKAVWNTGIQWTEKTIHGEFTVPKDQTEVTLTFKTITHNQGAVVSYIAVEKAPEEPIMTGIEVSTLPNKLVYQIGEELDTTGMVVTASCSDAQKIELSEEEYEVSELDSSEEGKKEITVTAISKEGTTFTDSFYVTVSEAEYYTTKIKVTKQPTKKTYEVNEEFDPTGMVVTAVKKASPSNATPYEEVVEDYELAYDFDTAGSKVVEILYTDTNSDGEMEEFTTSVKVTVKEAASEDEEYYTTKILVTKRPTKTVYFVGEEFDPEGMVVKEYKKASPSNAQSEEEIQEYLLKIPSFKTAGRKTIRVVYEAVGKDGQEKEFADTFSVQVKAYQDDDDDNDIVDNSMQGSWSGTAGSWTFKKADGSLAKNEWGFINGKWYRFDLTGKMQTDWVQDQGRWYFLNADGSMVEEQWVLHNGNWYYLHKAGTMLANQWFKSNGIWYYLNADGSMMKNGITPDGNQVDKDGKWITK